MDHLVNNVLNLFVSTHTPFTMGIRLYAILQCEIGITADFECPPRLANHAHLLYSSLFSRLLFTLRSRDFLRSHPSWSLQVQESCEVRKGPPRNH